MPPPTANSKIIEHDTLQSLRAVAAFAELSSASLKLLAAETKSIEVKRGEALITAGEKSDSLYIVSRGKFNVLVDGSPIAEIGIGEPVGELGFFADTIRTADVVAARSSEALVLDRAAYNRLSKKVPELAQSILQVMAKRLAANTGQSAKLRPRAFNVIALLPAASGEIPAAFHDRLSTSLQNHSDLRIIRQSDVPQQALTDPKALSVWLTEQERSHAILLLVGGLDQMQQNQIWQEGIADHCDMVFLVGEKKIGRSGPVAVSDLEKRILSQTLKSNLQLVVWREHERNIIRHTDMWLQNRDVGLHHHVALDSQTDFDRIARFMLGKARGIVLCGGGAFGTAHLGAIKALREHDIEMDMYGGTSVGAAMAAALSVGKDPSEVMDLCEDIFLRSKAMSRLAVPVHSIIDHNRFDEQMMKQYGEYKVEDTNINYFAVSTSLTTNDMHLIRSGELWKAVRASSSIPAVFPPMIKEDGEVLVDGALVDNVPINVMRELKAGPNLILNFAKGDPWRIHSDYNNMPGRLATVRRFLRRKKSDQRYPTIASVLSRTMVITARRLLNETDMEGDILLDMPTLPKMGFLEWKRGREQFNAAYEAMSQSLCDAGNCTSDAGEKLNRAAKHLSVKA